MKSPNRYDAAVYAIIELRELNEERPSAAISASVIDSAEVAKELRTRLARIGAGRRVGL
jgi:hypothetical protein